MELLDKLVLPQSAQHIQLINYLLIAIFFLFIPYIGILLVSSIGSLIYWKKGKVKGNSKYLNFAEVLIRIPTMNKSIGVVLGMLPFLTITFMIAQIMHGTDTNALSLLLGSTFLGAVGIVLIYAFRYSIDFVKVYDKISERISAPELDPEVIEKSKKSMLLARKTGLWGVVALSAALWMLFAVINMIMNLSLWDNSVPGLMFSWKLLLLLFQFLAISCSLTGALLLFIYFYWEGGISNTDEELSSFIKSAGLHLAFWGALAIPFFITLKLFTIEINLLSGNVFIFSTAALVMILIILNLLYGIFKEKTTKFSGAVFFLILFVSFSVILKDQSVFSNATEQQAAVLDSQFREYLATLTGNRGVEEISGKQIFDVRCSSCHQFDRKLVGPAYKDVLPKYEGKLDQLTSFVLSPVKMNPQFPPMPNPGLKPGEAKAVAAYIMETYKK